MTRTRWIIVLLVAAVAATAFVAVNQAQTPAKAPEAAPAPVAAEPLKPGPTKVAVCDIRRVVTEYRRFIDLKDLVTKQQETAQNELNRRRTVLEDLQKQQQALKPDSPDFKKIQDSILEKAVEAQAYGELTRTRLERQQYEGLRGCYQDVQAAIDAFARENGIDVVLTDRDIKLDEARNSQDLESLIAARYIIYRAPGVDVTTGVLKKLNDSYKP
jgi:Skp family chaperone for outer membrane proteins